MTSTERGSMVEGGTRIIEAVRDVEGSALEAVRKFVDTVDGVFPDVGQDGPRRKIIDSAFTMTEQLVGASNDLAQKILKTTSDALSEPKSGAGSSK